jgi:hypothetical protein
MNASIPMPMILDLTREPSEWMAQVTGIVVIVMRWSGSVGVSGKVFGCCVEWSAYIPTYERARLLLWWGVTGCTPCISAVFSRIWTPLFRYHGTNKRLRAYIQPCLSRFGY